MNTQRNILKPTIGNRLRYIAYDFNDLNYHQEFESFEREYVLKWISEILNLDFAHLESVLRRVQHNKQDFERILNSYKNNISSFRLSRLRKRHENLRERLLIGLKGARDSGYVTYESRVKRLKELINFLDRNGKALEKSSRSNKEAQLAAIISPFMIFNRGLEELREKIDTLSWISNRTNHPFPAELNNGLVSYLASRPAPVLTDLGAGEGRLCLDCVESVPSLTAILVDDVQHPTQVEHERVVFSKQNLNKPLPFAAEISDLTVANYVLPYLDNPLLLLNEMIRITKRDGFIIMDGHSSILMHLVDEEGNDVPIFDVVDSEKVTVYGHHFTSTTVIKVLDPQYQIELELDEDNSVTIKNGKTTLDKVIKYSNAQFVYRVTPVLKNAKAITSSKEELLASVLPSQMDNGF